jgi:hypothetical protein
MMASAHRDETPNASEPWHLGLPRGKVVGALEPAAVVAATDALIAAGLAADQIEVTTAADVEGLERPLVHSGLAGLVGRLLLSTGGDLDVMEEARQELLAGHALVSVPVAGDEVMYRVRDVLRAHGGHSIQFFGRWTITSLG